MASNKSVVVRKATKEDMDDVIVMIQELADFEQMSDGPKLTVEDLIRDGGFSTDSMNKKEPPLFFCFIAEEICPTTNTNDDGNVDLILNRHPMTRKSIGYSICFYSSYSTWGGRTLYMEDLYVKPDYRKNGVGKMFMQEIARCALQTGCVRIDFQALKWNPAVNFYKNLGAVDLTETKGWLYYVFRSEDLNNLELANFEKMFSEPQVNKEDLLRDGGFNSQSDPVIFVCFIAEILNESSDERIPIGYAIIFNGYSTWMGRTLKLKDLYVKDGHRDIGAGKMLIKAIANHAKEVNAARLYFHVLEWNKSARWFYESLGAVNWTESEEWALYRLEKDKIDNLAH